MDIEQRKAAFQDHHKNRANIIFHILCGLAYMGLLLSMLPFWATILYSIIVFFFFPTISVVAGLVLLGILRNSIEKEGLTIFTRALGVLVFYFLPELSHYLTKESTVLNLETITIYDAIDNFFFLYPQSVLALTKAGY